MSGFPDDVRILTHQFAKSGMELNQAVAPEDMIRRVAEHLVDELMQHEAFPKGDFKNNHLYVMELSIREVSLHKERYT